MTDETLTRLRLDISYDGTDFSGWAEQPGRRTVQGELQAALARVLRIPTPQLTVAGRTDAGVHARGQVAHVDVPASVWEAEGERLLRRLAGVLPPDVRVTAVAPAPRGVRRPVFRAVPPLRLPGERCPGRGGSAAPPRSLVAPPPLGRRPDERGCGRPAGRTRLRRLLPETGGSVHGPGAPAFGVAAGERARVRGHGASGRVLPQHGARPSGGAARGGGRPSSPGVACSSAPRRGTRFGGARGAAARPHVGGGALPGG